MGKVIKVGKKKKTHTKTCIPNLKSTVLWGANSMEKLKFPGLPMWHVFNSKFF
jgi:hypothetical protein